MSALVQHGIERLYVSLASPPLVSSITLHGSLASYEDGGPSAYQRVNSKVVCVMEPPCKGKAQEALFYDTLVLETQTSISIAEGEHRAGMSRWRRKGKPRAPGLSDKVGPGRLQDHKTRWLVNHAPTQMSTQLCLLGSVAFLVRTTFAHCIGQPISCAFCLLLGMWLGSMPVDPTHCLAHARGIKRAFVDDWMNGHCNRQPL